MVQSATTTKFLPLNFLGVSHRILWRNENAVCRLQIPALVPEILKFEKCVKFTNEMTDDFKMYSDFQLEKMYSDFQDV